MAPTGIVDLQLVEHHDGADDQQATHCTDHRCGDRRRRQRFCRDGDQAGERAVQRHRQIGLAEPEARQQQREDEAAGSRHVGVDEHERDGVGFADIGNLQLRAAVEAEPAEPQDQRAERRQRQVAAGNGVDLTAGAVLAFACAQQQDAGQVPPLRRTVHDTRARKVEEASRHPASRRPISRSPAPGR